MSLTEQLSQILDQYYDPNKNLKNIEEKKVDFADNGALKKINFLEQKMMTKSSSKQEQQSVNEKLEQLNFKKPNMILIEPNMILSLKKNINR